jgi:hypothetical protein
MGAGRVDRSSLRRRRRSGLRGSAGIFARAVRSNSCELAIQEVANGNGAPYETPPQSGVHSSATVWTTMADHPQHATALHIQDRRAEVTGTPSERRGHPSRIRA